MVEEEKLIVIEKHELVGRAAEFFSEGRRLVQICCTKLGNTFEMNYSFDKNYEFVNLRFTVQTGEEIPSISLIYWCAFIYENEIHDLFGIPIKNIVLDYGGTLYRTSVKAPFSIDNKKEDIPTASKTNGT